MLASSITVPPDFELPRKSATPISTLHAGTMFPRASSPRMTHAADTASPSPLIPRAVDIHVHSGRGKASADHRSPSPPPSPGHRFTPPTASPIRRACMEGVHATVVAPATSASDGGETTDLMD
jgi:hypothetical protein